MDHPGSTLSLTDATRDMVRERGFFQFGEEISPGFACSTKRITGHERDGETGFDYMLARYYGASLSRFLSPDPLQQSARPRQPQTWNRYTYVLNNPLLYVDPLGLVEETKKELFAEGSSDATSAQGKAGVIEGTVSGEAGELTVEGLTVEGEAHSSFEGGIDVGSSAEVKIIGAEGEASAFGGAVSAEGSIKGMAAGAEVEVGLSTKGAKAGVGAEAVIVSGEVSGSVSVFGISVTASVGGGVGAAAGAKAQIGEADAKKGSVASAKVKLGAPLFGSVGLKIRKE